MTQSTVSDNQVSVVLEDAAQALERDGWIQRQYYDVGGYCMVGAVMKVTSNNEQAPALRRAAGEWVRRVIGPVESISTWNDRPERTKAEVVAALREAAQLARQAAE